MRKSYSPITTMPSDQFATLCRESKTLAEIITKCGLRPDGNYPTLKRRIKREQINISHILLGLGSNRNRPARTRLSKEEVLKRLVEGSISSRGSIKAHLIKHDVLNCHHCSICGHIDEWNGQALIMQLDHIDGDATNNRLDNLRFVCANCHSQTPTFGKGQRTKRYHVCEACGQPRSCKSSPLCRKCYIPSHRPTKIVWPSDQELEKMVWTKPRTTLANELGVSGESIGKRCRKLGIPQPPRGYWTKVKSFG